MKRRSHQLNVACCRMFALPDKATGLNLGIVKDGADGSDRPAWDASIMQRGEPFFRVSLAEYLLKQWDQDTAIAHTTGIRRKSHIGCQILATQQMTELG